MNRSLCHIQQTAAGGLLAAAAFAGCASVNPREDYARTHRHLEEALGTASLYRPEDETAIEGRVSEFLEDGLTCEEAVQVTLLNNPRLQAALFRLGISRADFVQSGLFTNPTLSVSLRWPDGGGLTNLQAGLAQNIAELWQIKYRKRAAEQELDRTVLEVAREASVLALEARVAYWRAVRAARDRELASENLKLSRELIDLAISRREAGAGSDVDVNLARSQDLDTELAVQKAELSSIEARGALARLLGLTTSPVELKLADKLAAPTSWSLAPQDLVSAAMASRLDVRATRMAAAAARSRIGLEESRFLKSLELGISVERSARNSRNRPDWLEEGAFASAQAGQLTPPSLLPRERESTDWVVGPELGIELPIFDQNQAQIARAQYVYQQAVKVLDALEREITQDAHVALERARIASRNARFYSENVLPLREKALTLARSAYGAGRTTLLSVQEMQRQLLAARSGYVEALTNHALAIVELERAAGRPFAQLIGVSHSSTTPSSSSQTTEVPE